MLHHIFVRLNGKSYIERIKPTIAGPLVFTGFITAIAYLGTESAWVILAGLAFFSYFLNERMKWAKIYITEIRELAERKVRITYYEKDEIKEYIMNKDSLQIKRCSVPYRFRADKEQYLLIKDEEKHFSLKQYVVADWDDDFIDELMGDWQPDEQLAIAV